MYLKCMIPQWSSTKRSWCSSFFKLNKNSFLFHLCNATVHPRFPVASTETLVAVGNHSTCIRKKIRSWKNVPLLSQIWVCGISKIAYSHHPLQRIPIFLKETQHFLGTISNDELSIVQTCHCRNAFVIINLPIESCLFWNWLHWGFSHCTLFCHVFS